MDGLNKQFISGSVLKASELNEIVSKLNEIVSFLNSTSINRVVELGLDVNTTQNILYAGGKEYALEEVSEIDHIVETYTVPVVELSYPLIPSSGGTVLPTYSFTQVLNRTIYYKDGTEREETETITTGGIVSWTGTNNDGSVTAGPNELYTQKTITTAICTVTINGKSGSATEIVYQEAAIAPSTPIYIGILPNSITGFDSKAVSLVSSITSSMLVSAISEGFLNQKPTTFRETVVSNGSYQYFIGLVPEDLNYKILQYDGIVDFVPFAADPDQYSNGEVVLSLNGTRYKLYSQYSAISGIEFDVKSVTI